MHHQTIKEILKKDGFEVEKYVSSCLMAFANADGRKWIIRHMQLDKFKQKDSSKNINFNPWQLPNPSSLSPTPVSGTACSSR